MSPLNNSGERLYNYGFYIKNKLQKKRIEEEEKLHRQMTPKILPRSKSIYRDSAHFEDRLYYQSHNSSKMNMNIESTDGSHIYKKRATSKENVNLQVAEQIVSNVLNNEAESKRLKHGIIVVFICLLIFISFSYIMSLPSRRPIYRSRITTME